MRVLYFHHSIGLGGAPRSLSLLISGLDKREFEPIVVMPKRKDNAPVKELFKCAGAKVIEERDIRPFHGSTVAPCGSLKSKAYALLSFNRTVHCAERIVLDLQPSIVHLNSTCLVACAKGSHLVDPAIPVVAHIREPILKNWWGRNLASMNQRHIDRFIAIDQFGLDSIGNAKSNGSVIYNFVDSSCFDVDTTLRRDARAQYGWSDSDTVFLSLSRVSEANGALELANLIRKQDSKLHSSARFVVAGFANGSTHYASAAREILQQIPRCQTLPFVEDPHTILSASDVIVAPFTTSHSARSILEGAALGKPSIVSNLPNLRELINEGESGFVFDWNEEQYFVESVNRLCSGPLRDTMGESARKFARKHFNQEKNIEKTVEVYRKLRTTEHR